MPREVKVTTVRFPIEVFRLVEKLCQRMNLSKVAVITTALHELAEKKGVE